MGDPGLLLSEHQEKLRQLICKTRHLLIGKGNALPSAARGDVCDIDVGGARPTAQRVRPVAPKFREKLADLIKDCYRQKLFDHRHNHGSLQSCGHTKEQRRYSIMR